MAANYSTSAKYKISHTILYNTQGCPLSAKGLIQSSQLSLCCRYSYHTFAPNCCHHRKRLMKENLFFLLLKENRSQRKKKLRWVEHLHLLFITVFFYTSLLRVVKKRRKKSILPWKKIFWGSHLLTSGYRFTAVSLAVKLSCTEVPKIKVLLRLRLLPSPEVNHKPVLSQTAITFQVTFDILPANITKEVQKFCIILFAMLTFSYFRIIWWTFCGSFLVIQLFVYQDNIIIIWKTNKFNENF